MNENSSIDVVPKVVIDVSKYRIRIHRTTIKALGKPDYVLLLVNPEEKTIGILPTDQNDKKAHRIKYDNHSCEIYSMLFIETIGKLTNKFEAGHRYMINGKLITNKNLALFELEKAENFNNELQFAE